MKRAWTQGRVKNLINSLESGVSVNGEDRSPSETEPAVLKVSAVTYGWFDQMAAKPINGKELKRAKCTPKAGQIIISRASGTPSHVGACAFIDRDYPDRFLPDKLWQTVPSPDAEVDLKWLFYYLTSQRTKAKIISFATGTNIKNITQSELLAIPVSIPPLPEQVAIADLLSTWDAAIEKTEKLIVAKLEQRKGLMQQFLSGRQRFPKFVQSPERIEVRWGGYPADWGYIRIGDIAEQVSRKNKAGSALPVLSCTKHHGLVDSLKYFGKQVFSKDLSTYKLVKCNQFAYATNHIDEGSIGYQDIYDEAVISPMYTVFETNKQINDRFLYLLMKTELYRHIFEANTSASVDRRGSLRWKEFSKIHIPFPSVEEQEAIVSVFDSCDREIDLLQKQLDAFKKQKKGLMQQLLTGKARVKLENEVVA